MCATMAYMTTEINLCVVMAHIEAERCEQLSAETALTKENGGSGPEPEAAAYGAFRRKLE